MRPGKHGEIILEDRRDVRYMLRGAEQIEGPTPPWPLQAHVTLRKDEAATDINALSGDLSARETRRRLRTAEVRLDPAFTDLGMMALEAVANMSLPQAVAYGVRPDTATTMLMSYVKSTTVGL